MINVKKIEPKVSTAKKVIQVKDAYLDDNFVLRDESGAVFEQIKPELPPNASISFKISIELEDEDEDALDDEDEEDTDQPDGYNGLPF